MSPAPAAGGEPGKAAKRRQVTRASGEQLPVRSFKIKPAKSTAGERQTSETLNLNSTTLYPSTPMSYTWKKSLAYFYCTFDSKIPYIANDFFLLSRHTSGFALVTCST